jgi:hypothetical protein
LSGFIGGIRNGLRVRKLENKGCGQCKRNGHYNGETVARHLGSPEMGSRNER